MVKKRKLKSPVSMVITKSGVKGSGQTYVNLAPRSATGKALSVKGGFIPPRTILNNPNAWKAAQNFAQGKHAEGFKSAAKAALGASDSDIDNAFRTIDMVHKAARQAFRKPTTVKGTSVEQLSNGESLASSMTTQTSRGLDSLHSQIHKIVCHTGRPTTKSLKNIAKEETVITSTKFDTRQNSSSSQVSRQSLSHSSGFNLRQFHIPSPQCYLNYFDLQEYIDKILGDVQRPDGLKERTYLSFLNTRSEFAVYNQSATIPANIKIHLVRPKTQMERDEEANTTVGEDIIANCLFGNPKIANPGTVAKAERKVPAYYQESAPSTAGATSDVKSFHWEHSLKGGGLYDSAYFRMNYTIEKTFSKTLKPTDLLRFKHVHHFGPGIDAYKAALMNAEEGGLSANFWEPVTGYFYIFESKGAQNCQLTFNNSGTNEPYIGVAPSFYFMDYRKTVQYIANKSSASLTNDGTGRLPVHMRVYSNDPVFGYSDSNSVEFRLKSEDIAYSSVQGYTTGKGYISYLTDAIFRTDAVADINTKDTGV